MCWNGMRRDVFISRSSHLPHLSSKQSPLSVAVSVAVSVCLSVCPFVCLPLCHLSPSLSLGQFQPISMRWGEATLA